MTILDMNTMDQRKLKDLLYQCCGCNSWAKIMLTHFPTDSMEELMENVAEVWNECSEDEWKEAFDGHPRIGDLKSLEEKYGSTSAAKEQASVLTAPPQVLQDLAEANRAYEEKFGHIFIVFATGKTPEEMLNLIRSRMNNSPESELRIAAAEQLKITRLRLEKLLQ